MSLSTPGIGTGLKIKEMVDASVQAEIIPLQTRHDNQLKGVNTELSAIGQLKSFLGGFQTSLSNMSDLGQFYSMKASISDGNYLSATIKPETAKGTYQIEIQKLAQQQSLASGYFVNNSVPVGSGNITINFGSYNNDKTAFTLNPEATPISITIPSGSGNLTQVRDAINTSNSGVSAAIVQDASGSRLTITSAKTGERYAMKISGDITALNYDPTTGVNSLTESIAAQDSVVKLNGLTLTQGTNSLENAISGMTLNLKKAELGKTITLNVDADQDQLTSLVNDFIKKYNDSMTFLTNLTGYNAQTKTAGLFQSDPQLRNLKLSLNRWATSPLANSNGAIRTLADLGITTNKQGLLEMNQTKFNSALANHYSEIGTLFAKTATTTDGTVKVNSVGSNIKAGSYTINLSEFTPGVSMAGTIGTFPASSSNGLTLNASGVLNGLSIDILSGSTGARGQVVVKDGIASLMNNLLSTYMDDQGDLSQRTTQLTKRVAQLGKVQEQIDIRKTSLEGRYTKQFNALDLILSQLLNQSKALEQQIASLPKINN